MVDKKVQKISDDFVREWSKYLAVNPILQLDYSWPSLGVLDLITYTCRFKKDIPQPLSEMLKGISAYLAIIAVQCFKAVVDEVNVVEEEQSIAIYLKGGKLIPDGEFVLVPVEKMFREILSELPNPFPVTRTFKTDITFDSHVVSYFGIGLFTGLAPGIEGWWNSKSEDFLAPVIENSSKILAIQSANYYGLLFPNEPLGQIAEFYLNKLIYPPMMMRESLPLLEAVPEVLQYFKDYQISSEAALKLGENLALSPDPLFSNLGLILCCALSNKIPSEFIIAAAQRKGSYVAFLRRSVRKVREFYGMNLDWIEAGLRSQELLSQLAVEKSLKFLPWLYLSKNRIKEDIDNNILTPLIVKICDYDIVGAIGIADKILAIHPDDAEVIMQSIKLESIKGEHADLEKIKFLEKQLISSAKADSMPEYYSLMGSIALGRKDPTKALSYFKAGQTLNITDPSLLSDLQNNAAWCCILLNKLGQALIYLEQSLTNSNCPVTILLNKASVLWDLGDVEGAIRARRELVQLSPLDRRVFASITLEETIKNKHLQ